MKLWVRLHAWDIVEAVGGLLVTAAATTVSITVGLLVGGVILIIAANVGGAPNDDR